MAAQSCNIRAVLLSAGLLLDAGMRGCLSVRVVNVFEDGEMEEGPGRDRLWFRVSQLRPRLHAARIGAGLYEAREGIPIWPYHYHYPDGEWLYVLDVAPVLHDAGGWRVLNAGDVACFPPGHRGAHTLEGPGRFVLFSGESSSVRSCRSTPTPTRSRCSPASRPARSTRAVPTRRFG
jgi:hypothetical protein